MYNLYKRGRVYWCRVVESDGRIRRKSTKCKDIVAAQNAAREFEREATNKDHATAKTTRLDTAVIDYIAELNRRRRSASTIEIAETKSGHFLRIWKPEFLLHALTAQKVADYIDKRAKEGVVPLTIKKELGALKGILDVAKHLNKWVGEPKGVLPLLYSGEHKPRSRWLPMGEFERLLANLDKARAAHIAFIVATGARRGESFRARRSDVDFVREVVAIRGTKTKGAADDVPVTEMMKPILQFALEAAPGRDRLFAPWGNLTRDLKAACVRAGIAECTPNDLRRTFGKLHRHAGVEPHLLASMLRHTTDKLAQTTYGKVTGAETGELVKAAIKSVSNSSLTYEKKKIGLDEREASADPNGALEALKQLDYAGADSGDRIPDLRFTKPESPNRAERLQKGTKVGKSRARNSSAVPDMQIGGQTAANRELASDRHPAFGIEQDAAEDEIWAVVDAAERGEE